MTPDQVIAEITAQRNAATEEMIRLQRVVCDLGDEISRYRNTIAALKIRLDVAMR